MRKVRPYNKKAHDFLLRRGFQYERKTNKIGERSDAYLSKGPIFAVDIFKDGRMFCLPSPTLTTAEMIRIVEAAYDVVEGVR